jgi:hypothetical protein
MFADPQSITLAGAAKTLPRVSAGDYTGEFRASDGAIELIVKHSNGNRGRERSVIRSNHRKIGANPLDPSRNLPYTSSVYVVLEAPAQGQGFTLTELEDQVKALAAYLTAANITKFVGKES